MKKLIIAASAVMAAVAVNAATINWNSSAMYLPTAEGKASETKASSGAAGKAAAITMQLWVIDQATYDSLYNADAATMVANVVNAYKGKTTFDASGNTSTKAMVTLADSKKTYAVGDTAYAAILFTTEANGEAQYLGNLGAYTFKAGDDFQQSNMGSFALGDNTGTNISGMWTAAAVPEPTSGLLLLLGVAGLALKRKRA